MLNVQESVCSEVYDLLQENDYTQQFKNEWLLYRASSNAPLREVRIRSFKPMVKNSNGEENCYATLKIKPYVFDYDVDLQYASSKFYNNFNLYNTFLPTFLNPSTAEFALNNGVEYKVQFNPRLDSFIDDINNAISTYFNGFDFNGTFDFTDGTKHSYLTDYSNSNNRATTLVTKSYHYCTELRNGYYLFTIYDEDLGSTYWKICYANNFDTAYNIPVGTSISQLPVACAFDASCDNVIVSFNNGSIYKITNKHDISIFSAPTGNVKFVTTNGRKLIVITSDNTTYINRIWEYDAVTANKELIFTFDSGMTVTTVCPFGTAFMFGVTVENAKSRIYAYDGTNVDMLDANLIDDDVVEIRDLIYSDGIVDKYFCFRNFADNYVYRIKYGSYYDGHSRIWNWQMMEKVSFDNLVTRIFTYGDAIMAITYNDKLYKVNRENGTKELVSATFSHGNAKISSGIIRSAIFDNTNLLYFYLNENFAITIQQYLQKYGTGTLIPNIIKLHNADVKENIYCHNIMFPMFDKLLMFAIEIYTEPVSLLSTNTNEQIFDNIRQIGFSYLNPSIVPIFTFVYNYDEKVENININSVEDYLVLCSPHMNNISQIIYAGETTAQVVFKKIDTLPSANYLAVYLKDNHGKIMTKNDLKDVYGRIIVEIDYIYHSMA